MQVAVLGFRAVLVMDRKKSWKVLGDLGQGHDAGQGPELIALPKPATLGESGWYELPLFPKSCGEMEAFTACSHAG